MVSTGVQAPWRRSPRHRCQWGIGTVLLKLQKTMHLRTERTIVSNSCFNDPHWKLSKSLTCNLGSLGHSAARRCGFPTSRGKRNFP